MTMAQDLIAKHRPRQPAGIPRNENSGTRSETGPSNESLFSKRSNSPAESSIVRRPHLLAFLGYGLLVLLSYAPFLLGTDTFPAGDFTDHFLPFHMFQRSELLAGRLPIWNPLTFSGHPFLADIQAAVFYPLGNLVLLLTLPFDSAAARLYTLQIEALIHFVLAGFFTYLLAYALVRRWLPAFLAGGIFMLSGYLTGYPALQLAVLRTAIWLPLVLWLLLRAFQQPARWRWWLGAALMYAVAFLAGHPQTFLHLSYAVLAWIALLLFLARRQQSPQMRLQGFLTRIALFYGLFVGLSAAQLLPSMEFTRLSVRANADYAFVSGGFPLSDTWQVLLPGLVSQYSALFVGIVGLGLALLAIAQASIYPPTATRAAETDITGNTRWFVAYFAALALVAWLVSYGRHGFLYPLFFRWMPGWNLFQGQERAAYLVAFGLSLLAGFGATALDRLSTRQRRGFALAFALLVAAGVAGFVWRYQATGEPGVNPAQVWQAIIAAGAVLAISAATLWMDRMSRPVSLLDRFSLPPDPENRTSWRLVVMSSLALAELFLMNRGTLSGGVPLAQQVALPAAAQAVQQAVQQAGDVNASWGTTSYQGPPGRVYNEHRVFEDYGIRVGVEDLWGSSPLRLSRYDTLVETFPLDRLWQLTGVEHVLNSQADLYQPAEKLAELPGTDGAIYLHRLAQPAPRVWVVNTVQSLEDGQALPLLADARFDASATALLPPVTDTAGRAGFSPEGLLAMPGQNTVQLQQLAPGRLHIDVQSEHGGLLMVNENWLPGWQATVRREGGETSAPAPMLRADVAFLGVPIGPGRSTVDLVYRPDSLRIGLLISIMSLLALAFGAGLFWLQRARRTGVRPLQQPSNENKAIPLRLRSAPPPVRGSQANLPQWVMVSVMLVAFGLRVFRLGYQELRGDETFGYFFSQDSLAEIIRSTLALREPHPVASYFLEKAWFGLAGHSEFALRFISAWFGVLAVALLYRLGRRLGFGTLTATLAAALMAIAPYAIWHSQDARMYSLSLALTLASTWLAIELLHTSGRLRNGLTYVVVSWLALQTHYFAVFVLLAQNIFVLALAFKDLPIRRVVVRWLLYQVLLGMLYLPWLLVAANTLTGYRGNGDSPAFAAMLQRALSVFGVGETVPVEQRTAVAVLAGVLLVIGAIRLFRAGPEARRALFLLALYLAVPLLATWISALQRPIFNERYLIAAAPPFFLLLAIAVLGWGKEMTWLAARDERRPVVGTGDVDDDGGARHSDRLEGILAWTAAAALGLLLVGALGALVNYYTNPIYSKTRGWRELAATLERYSAGLPAGNVRLAQNFPDPTLWYYYDGPVAHLVLPPAANDEARTAQEVTALAAGDVQRLVVPLQPEDWWDSDRIAQRALAEQYTLVATTQVAGWPVDVYTRPPDNLQPVGATFKTPGRTEGAANGLRLAAMSAPKQELIPGDVLDVYLAWEGDEQMLTGSEKVTLQLLDGAGRLVAQTDQPLEASDLRASSTTYALSIPWQLQPGNYRLIAALYDPAQPGAPRLLTESGADFVELAVIPRVN